MTGLAGTTVASPQSSVPVWLKFEVKSKNSGHIARATGRERLLASQHSIEAKAGKEAQIGTQTPPKKPYNERTQTHAKHREWLPPAPLNVDGCPGTSFADNEGFGFRGYGGLEV